MGNSNITSTKHQQGRSKKADAEKYDNSVSQQAAKTALQHGGAQHSINDVTHISHPPVVDRIYEVFETMMAMSARAGILPGSLRSRDGEGLRQNGQRTVDSLLAIALREDVDAEGKSFVGPQLRDDVEKLLAEISRKQSSATERHDQISGDRTSLETTVAGVRWKDGDVIDCLRVVLQRLADCGVITSDSVDLAGRRRLSSWVSGETSLMTATRRRDARLLSVLLDFGSAELISRRNRRGQTALDQLIESMFPVISDSPDHVYFRPEPHGNDDPLLWETFRTLVGSAWMVRRSRWIGWLILHAMHDAEIIRLLCCSVVGSFGDIATEQISTNKRRPTTVAGERTELGLKFRRRKPSKSLRRLRAVLFQISVKYAQTDNILLLLNHAQDVSEFWSDDGLAARRRLFPDDAVVTWPTIDRIATSFPREFLTLVERVVAGLPLPVPPAALLLRAANSPDVARRIIDELVRGCGIEDNFETGKAVEVFYPYASMCLREVAEAGALLTLVDEFQLEVEPTTIDKFCRRYGIDANGQRELGIQGHFQGRRMRTLKSLARSCIRVHMKCNVIGGVRRLTCLPALLRDYVTARK